MPNGTVVLTMVENTSNGAIFPQCAVLQSCDREYWALTGPGSSRNPSRACPERGENSFSPIVLCSSSCLSIVSGIRSNSPGMWGRKELSVSLTCWESKSLKEPSRLLRETLLLFSSSPSIGGSVGKQLPYLNQTPVKLVWCQNSPDAFCDVLQRYRLALGIDRCGLIGCMTTDWVALGRDCKDVAGRVVGWLIALEVNTPPPVDITTCCIEPMGIRVGLKSGLFILCPELGFMVTRISLLSSTNPH